MTKNLTNSSDWRPGGLIAASITPFRDDESLDLARLERHLDELIAAGVDAVAVVAGSGEFVNLAPDERVEVIRTAVGCVNGRVPVIVGVLAPSTREGIGVAEAAARHGADALLVTPPYYIRPSLDGVLGHIRAIAGAAALPVIAYNNPARTGWPIGVRELVEIAALPGVVGVKDCDRDVAAIGRKVAAVPPDFAVLSGDDDLGLTTILGGAAGGFWATPNLAPRLCRALVDAALARDADAALPLHRRLLRLVTAWDRPNHPGPLKELMALAGRDAGLARRPLAFMTEAERAIARDALEAAAPIE